MPLAAHLSPRLALLVRLAGALAPAGALAYFGYEAFAPGGPVWDAADYVAYYGLLVVAAGLCLARGLAIADERLPWLALGAGMLAWTAGDAIWSVLYASDPDAPYPSIADGLYLLFYPAAYVALIVMLRRRARGLGAALVQRADVAMYQAKGARTGVEIYRAARDLHSRDRLQLVSELRRAIEDRELTVHYQPKATLAGREITGVEALVRWQHPQRGLLPPADFLPLAEQTGLMRPLTLFVLDEALCQCAAWARDGIELSVAVNLGQVNLIDRQLPGDVAAALERWGVAPERLHLEITENLVMADPARTAEVLAGLREVGVGLSLDARPKAGGEAAGRDRGTGQTSLAYLRRLALDEIKIDRSFVLELGRDEDAAAIVRSTVQMAQALRLRVVAEGAEDAGAMRRLQEFGCELVQGFFLSPPLPAAELTEWLRAQSLNAAA